MENIIIKMILNILYQRLMLAHIVWGEVIPASRGGWLQLCNVSLSIFNRITVQYSVTQWISEINYKLNLVRSMCASFTKFLEATLWNFSENVMTCKFDQLNLLGEVIWVPRNIIFRKLVKSLGYYLCGVFASFPIMDFLWVPLASHKHAYRQDGYAKSDNQTVWMRMDSAALCKMFLGMAWDPP